MKKRWQAIQSPNQLVSSYNKCHILGKEKERRDDKS